MVKLLIGFGYSIRNKGKTSGSRIRFINKETMSVIDMHKPHLSNVINEGVMKDVYTKLKNNFLIDEYYG